MARMTAAVTMRGGRWCRCNDVTISHNVEKSHKWQQRLCFRTRGCSSSCVCKQEACCRWTGIRSGQEAPADGNGNGSEDNGNEGIKENEGVKGNKGEGNEGDDDDGNFPEGGGRGWTQQSTRY
jgi:hypothetical protein